MKKYIFSSFLFCFFVLSLTAQNINKIEYFFDTDPGLGNATALSIGTPDTVVDVNTSIVTSGLANGLHILYVRAKNDLGNWSPVSQATFFKTAVTNNNKIVALEYYFDTDPGLGSATDIPVTADTVVDVTTSILTDGLTNGLHMLYVRSKDINGNWSPVSQATFFKTAVTNNNKIVALEYYFDTDPGLGSANDIPVTADTAVDVTTSILTDGLTNGLHMLYVRSKDINGNWSPVSQATFFKTAITNNNKIVALEYYFDTDPGLGSANDIPVTADTAVDVTTSILTDGFANGLHTLYVRSKDINGNWSPVSQAIFFKQYANATPIELVEYYFDTDPGFGNGTAYPITPPSDSVQETITVDVSGLTPGEHIMYIRAKDLYGLWSTVAHDTINIEGCRYLDSLALVDLYNATDGANWKYGNRWDLAQPITTWHGVFLNNNDCVNIIDLDGDSLNGYIPDLNLLNLEILSLRSNMLGDSALPDFSKMLNLKELNLWSTDLQYQIPNFTNLPKLEKLNLGKNELFNTSIPDFNNCLSLREISFQQISNPSNDSMIGGLPTFSNCDSLEIINIELCNISGIFPDYNNKTYLREIIAGFNNFSGIFPDLSNLTNLEVLQVQESKLDSFPDLSNITAWGTSAWQGLKIWENSLTFDDILPNIPIGISHTYSYGGQDTAGIVKTLTAVENTVFIIQLDFDYNVTSSIYYWYKGSTPIDTTTTNYLTLSPVTAADAGVYNVKVVNSVATSLTLYVQPITLNVQLAPCYTIFNLGNDTILCSGNILPLNPNISNATYLWSDGSTDTTFNISSTGIYSVIIDSSGCIKMDTIIVNFNPTQQTTIDTTICDNETVIVNNIVHNSTGNYTYVLPTWQGCDSTITLNLLVHPTQQTTIDTTICDNETVIVNNIVHNSTGNYTYVLPTWQGCDSTVTLNLLVHPTQQTTIDTTICDNETVILNGIVHNSTGNYTYVLPTWQGCDSTITLNLLVHPTQQTTIDTTICDNETVIVNGIVHNSTGNYTYVLPTWQGCDSTITLNLLVHPTQQTTIDTTICDNETVILNGIVHNSTGNYTYVLPTWQGCDSTITLNLLVHPTQQTTIDTTICHNESITINGTIYNQSNPTGTEIIAIGSSTNCDSIVNINLSFHPISQTNVITDSVSCFSESDGTATVNILSGTPNYTYLWSNQEVLGSITNLTAGVYYVTITDGNNCSTIDSGTVLTPVVLDANATIINNVLCHGASNGSVKALSQGGRTPYSYLWSTGATTSLIDSLSSGTYHVTVTDANGCTAIDSIYVNTPNVMIIDIVNVFHVSCADSSDGSVQANVSGGVQPHSYQWLDSPPSGIVRHNLEAGQYYLTVTDFNGCMVSDSVTITEPTVINIMMTIDTAIACHGDSTGGVIANIIGGIPSYSYLWTNGDTTAQSQNLWTGWHTVIVTDSNNCQMMDSILLNEPTAITATTMVTPDLCNQGLGTFTVFPSGGMNSYNYNWSANSNNSNTISSLSSGSYTVTITDTNNCSIQVSDIILDDCDSCTIYPPIISQFSDDFEYYCFGNDSVEVYIDITGGQPTYNNGYGAYIFDLTINGNNVTTQNNSTGSLSFFLVNGDDWSITVSDSSQCFLFQTGDIFIEDTLDCDNYCNLYPLSITVSENDSILIPQEVQMYVNTDGSNVIWRPNYELDCNDCFSPIATPEESTTYIVTAYGEYGCTAIDSVIIIVYEPLDIPLPVGNSPLIIPEVSEYPINHLYVVNRWGKIVYDEEKYNNDWYGRGTDGRLLREDTYYFYLETSPMSDTEIIGSILLIRN